MKVDYSTKAIQDLKRIRWEVYTASGSEEVTKKYVYEIMQTIESKITFPKSGSPVYFEEIFTGYYSVTFKAYIAFYHVEENNDMFVDRILLGKSDYIRVLFGGKM